MGCQGRVLKEWFVLNYFHFLFPLLSFHSTLSLVLWLTFTSANLMVSLFFSLVFESANSSSFEKLSLLAGNSPTTLLLVSELVQWFHRHFELYMSETKLIFLLQHFPSCVSELNDQCYHHTGCLWWLILYFILAVLLCPAVWSNTSHDVAGRYFSNIMKYLEVKQIILYNAGGPQPISWRS